MLLIIVLVIQSLIAIKSYNSDCIGCPGYRYIHHYEALGCKALHRQGCSDCIEYYKCPKWMIHKNSCFYSGKVYKIHEKISKLSRCQTCQCSSHNQKISSQIACIPRACSEYNTPIQEIQRLKQPDNDSIELCYYEHDSIESCCGQKKCFPKDEFNRLPECKINHKQGVKHGEIYFKQDPCSECICDATKFHKDSEICRFKECLFDVVKLNQGCVPVYSLRECCPLRYICPLPRKNQRKVQCSQSLDNGTCELAIERFYYDHKVENCFSFVYSGCGGNLNNFEYYEDCMGYCKSRRIKRPYERKCFFAGINYNIGNYGPTINNEPMVKCKCLIPPMLTCFELVNRNDTFPPYNNDKVMELIRD